MEYFWNGVQLGLALAILLGPIFFALIQAGVERGFRAGAAVGAGIWISDLLFILFVFWSRSYLDAVINNNQVIEWLGLAGGILLIAIGAGSLITEPPSMKDMPDLGVKKAPYHLLWLKGFLINSLNPFTVFFWISVMTGIVLARELDSQESNWFFGGVLLTIIATDLTKVILAKHIRKVLKRRHIRLLRKISGMALIVFGVVIMLRVVWQTS